MQDNPSGIPSPAEAEELARGKELHEIKLNAWASAIGKRLTGVELEVEAPSAKQPATRLTFTDAVGGCVQIWVYLDPKMPVLEVVVDEAPEHGIGPSG
jgi:hypothetical protein